MPDCTLRCLYRQIFFPYQRISFREPCYKVRKRARRVVRLISVRLLKCIARLFSGGLCSSSVARKELYPSKPYLIIGLLFRRIKMEFSQSGLL